MPASRLASFVEQLANSQLFPPAQLAEVRRIAAQVGDDVRRLAHELLRRGWLTTYQINQVAAGRARDLTVGPYRILDRLGEGSMGQVFKAHHQHMQRTVALKLIRKELLARPEAVQRFYQELRVAGHLVHPNIVVAYDAGQAGNTHYFAMEYVDGVDLDRLVRESGPLPVDQACGFVRQAALGLQHAFEHGMVHRDVKPHNLLVTRTARGPKAPRAAGQSAEVATVKILDLGLARLEGADDREHALTQQGVVMGSPAYLSPEQALDAHAADVRSDLYSLGCTFYYLLTGRPPFQAEALTQLLLKHQMEEPVPVRRLRPEVPEGVAAVVRKLMAKRPEDRYQTPAELAQALAPWCGRDGIDGQAVPRPAPPPAPDPAAEWAMLTRDAGGPTAVVKPPTARAKGRGPWLLLGTLAAVTGVAAVAAAALLVVMFTTRRHPAPLAGSPRDTSNQLARATAPAPPDTEKASGPDEPSTHREAPADTAREPKATERAAPPPMPPPKRRPTPMPEPKPEPAPERLPVPDEAAQAKAEKEIHDLYKTEYARRAPSDKVGLANKLLDKGRETTDDPAARYVLWREARDLAAGAGDAGLALRAAGELATTYAVDDTALKRETLDKVAPAAQTQAARKALAESALAAADEAAAADRYDAAADFLRVAKAAAANAGSPSLTATVQARDKEVGQLRQDYEAVKPAVAKLKKDPTDPDANLAVGKFWCFDKGNWEKGLPLLAAGSNVKLAELADKDLAAPPAAADQEELAEDWWQLAQGEQDTAKTNALRRAFYWYNQALTAGLTGLSKTKAESRTKAIREQVPGLEPPVSVKEYTWAKGDPPVPMLRASEGFCLLASLSGSFDGIGEDLALALGNGTWYLAGKAGPTEVVRGTAIGVRTPLRRQFRPEVRQATWQTGLPPVRLLHQKDGFCFLASVSGAFRGNEEVGVSLGSDGYWYLTGHAGEKVVGLAVSMRTLTPGSFRAEVKEYHWANGEKPVKMIPEAEGFCYLSAVGGDLRGYGEEVRVYVGPDGYWYLDGHSGQASLGARAISVRMPKQ